MQQRNKLIFFIVIAVAVLAGLVYKSMQQTDIVYSHEVVCGKVISVRNARMGPIMDYQFFYNNELIKMTGVGCRMETQEKFNSGIAIIYVVFQPNNPRNNQVLESDKDFKTFNISREDTMGKACD